MGTGLRPSPFLLWHTCSRKDSKRGFRHALCALIPACPHHARLLPAGARRRPLRLHHARTRLRPSGQHALASSRAEDRNGQTAHRHPPAEPEVHRQGRRSHQRRRHRPRQRALRHDQASSACTLHAQPPHLRDHDRRRLAHLRQHVSRRRSRLDRRHGQAACLQRRPPRRSQGRRLLLRSPDGTRTLGIRQQRLRLDQQPERSGCRLQPQRRHQASRNARQRRTPRHHRLVPRPS